MEPKINDTETAKEKISERELFIQHLSFLREITPQYLTFLVGEQDSLKRFLFCATEKLSKMATALWILYPAIYEFEDVELSMGILMRSLLMDSILTQYLRYFTLTLKQGHENFGLIAQQLEQESLKLIADGTMNIFDDLLTTDKIALADKKIMAQKIAAKFVGLFTTDKETGLLKLREQDRVSIKKMHEKAMHTDQHTKKTVYELYAWYSKYDHVSHWTSIFGNIGWEDRLRRVHFSILNILFNFRDLLVLGQWQPSVAAYGPSLIKILDDHMNTMSPANFELVPYATPAIQNNNPPVV